MQQDELKATLIWDFPLRLFHWLLVVGIIAMFVTANLGSSLFHYHILLGQGMLLLLLFRMVWGFVGGKHARFRDFLYSPKAIKTYLKGLSATNYNSTGGHNPLGSLSVWLILILLSTQTITGLFATDDISHSGPLNFLTYGDMDSLLTELHHLNFLLLLLVIAIHIGAVLYYQFFKRQNLIATMWHGWKPANAAPNFSFALARRGGVVFFLTAVVALISIWLIQTLA